MTGFYYHEISISIHAPARGATGSGNIPNQQRSFQSTLPRGERRFSPWLCLSRSVFQSTLPRGERRDRTVFCLSGMRISIHAPARGATPIMSFGLPSSVFQSTLPRGERLRARSRSGGFRIFQSTLPRGERPSSACFQRVCRVFQSTLPRGERLRS